MFDTLDFAYSHIKMDLSGSIVFGVFSIHWQKTQALRKPRVFIILTIIHY